MQRGVSRRQLLGGTAATAGGLAIGGTVIGTVVSDPGDGEILLGPKIGETKSALGRTFVGPARSGIQTHPLDTGASTVEVSVVSITEDHLLGKRGRRVVATQGQLPDGVGVGSCLRALAVNRTLERGALAAIPVHEGPIRPPDPPTAEDRYLEWIDHARTIRAHGEPVVGVSKFVTNHLEALEHFGMSVTDRLADVLDREVPPDVLRMTQILVDYLASTDIGQDVAAVGESISKIRSDLESVLETVPDAYETAGRFIEGREGVVGVPIAIETMLNIEDTTIDYLYTGQVLFGQGGRLVLSPGDPPAGVTGLIRRFALAVEDMYQNYEELTESVQALASALKELPSAKAKSIASAVQLLATAMDFAGRSGHEDYVDPVRWCAENYGALHSELASTFARLKEQSPAEATNIFGDREPT